jgi:predicted RNase H-like HicB family nuclease
MLYNVLLKKTDEGYSVWVPNLPGCWSQGDSEVEAIENIKDAIKSWQLTFNEINSEFDKRLIEVA